MHPLNHQQNSDGDDWNKINRFQPSFLLVEIAKQDGGHVTGKKQVSWNNFSAISKKLNERFLHRNVPNRRVERKQSNSAEAKKCYQDIGLHSCKKNARGFNGCEEPREHTEIEKDKNEPCYIRCGQQIQNRVVQYFPVRDSTKSKKYWKVIMKLIRNATARMNWMRKFFFAQKYFQVEEKL